MFVSASDIREKTLTFLCQEGFFRGRAWMDGLEEAFLREMREGLAGRASSLPMLPSFLPVIPWPRNEEKIITVDAGGTNLRVSLLRLLPDGNTDLLYREVQPIPGKELELTADEFFMEIARAVLPVAEESNRIGFCFSFTCDAKANLDSEIIVLDKEIRVTGASGRMVGASLEEALLKLGAKRGHRITVLNDTVATLLGSAARRRKDRYSGFTGVIIGTGYNVCYEESNAMVMKLPALREKSGRCIINTEAGAFDCLELTETDRALGRKTLDPAMNLTEKMIGGEYQGKLMACLTTRAVDAGTLSDSCAARFAGREKEISAADITSLLTGPTSDSALAGMAYNECDLLVLTTLAEGILDRAASLITANLTAVAVQTGAGREKPMFIAVEGSTYHKNPVFREKLHTRMRENLTERDGILWECGFEPDANETGSAIAALAGD